MAYTLSVLLLGSWGAFDWDWYTSQAMLWLLLTAGYLLPRLDRYEMVFKLNDKLKNPKKGPDLAGATG
jgi:hypothetical protein